MSDYETLDADLIARLELLKTRFGVGYELAEPEAEAESPALIDPFGGHEQIRPVMEVKNEETTASVSPKTPKLSKKASGRALQTALKDTPFLPPLDCTKFVVGQCVDADVEFCSWKEVKAYPENFIGKTNRPRAQPFFDKILEDRVWDFFYLFHPEKPEDGSRLLVPSLQFEAFLYHINRQLGTNLTIPLGVNKKKFNLTFGQGGTPRPRYLKRTRDEKALHVESWPDVDEEDVAAFRRARAADQENWKAKWLLMKPQRPWAKNSGKKRQQKTAQRREDQQSMLDAAQRYLHLKGSCGKDVVLVCVDVEALEVAPHPVSEVGLSILDVEHICRVPPGPCGQDWWPFIESSHIRVQEYCEMVNHRYVKGCPSQFDFGTSMVLPSDDVAKYLDSLLGAYVNQGRCLIFVGHDLDSDVRYLLKVGFDVLGIQGFRGHLDTKTIHQAWKSSDDGRGLGGILAELCIPSQHLHNAGNDAAYTLRALLGIATEEIRESEAMTRGEEYVPSLFAQLN